MYELIILGVVIYGLFAIGLKAGESQEVVLDGMDMRCKVAEMEQFGISRDFAMRRRGINGDADNRNVDQYDRFFYDESKYWGECSSGSQSDYVHNLYNQSAANERVSKSNLADALNTRWQILRPGAANNSGKIGDALSEIVRDPNVYHSRIYTIISESK